MKTKILLNKFKVLFFICFINICCVWNINIAKCQSFESNLLPSDSTIKMEINDEDKSSSLELTAPAINELFAPEAECIIEWNSSDIEYIKLEYSLNNGLDWSTIVASISAGSGSYTWNLLKDPGRYKLRISDYGNAGTFDEVVFSVGAVYVKEPSGGEVYNSEWNLPIQWIVTEVQKINISYSVNNGSSYLPIVSDYSSYSGSYSWNIPENFSDSCLIKITSSDNVDIFDISDNVFRIFKLNIISPSNGSLFAPDSSLNLEWKHGGIDSVNIKISRDMQVTWEVIESNLSDTLYTFKLPSETGRFDIRVSDAIDSNAFDMIQGSICEIDLVSPNKNEVWKAGDTYKIIWTKDPYFSPVRIRLSLDSGLVYNDLGNFYTNEYLWTIPDNNSYSSDKCIIKVEANSNATIFDASEKVFSIYNLNLLSPVNTTYQEGQNVEIQWNSHDIEYLDLDYSYDNGLTWIIIAEYINASIGKYNWFIPDVASEKYLFRISDSENPLKVDETAFKVSTDVPFSDVKFYDDVSPNNQNPQNMLSLGEPLRFKIKAENNYGQNLLTLKGTISSGSPYVTISDGKGSFNNVLEDLAEWSADEFEIIISEDTPPNHEISFILTMEDEIINEGPWKSVFSIPFLNISRVLINDDNYDDSDGNNNNSAEPGEMIELLPLINNGSKISFNNVIGTIESSESDISIKDNVFISTDSIFSTNEYGYLLSGGSDFFPESDFVFENNKTEVSDISFAVVLEGYTEDEVLIKYYCPFVLSQGIPENNPESLVLDNYVLGYNRIEFYENVMPDSSNPENIIAPGKKVRFKLQLANSTSDLFAVRGKISSVSPYVQIVDSTASFNNVSYTIADPIEAWSSDEFEIILADDLEGTGCIQFVLSLYDDFLNFEPIVKYFAIPVPYLQLIEIDDDDNPDSKGNNNNIAEPGETIEIIPVLQNNSASTIYKMNGKFIPYSENALVWNERDGSNTIVYDTYRYNVFNHNQVPVSPVDSNIIPEEDFVFDHIGNDTNSIYFTLLTEGYINDMPGDNWYEDGILMKWGIPGVMNEGYPVDPVSVKIVSPEDNAFYDNDTTFNILIYANSPENLISKVELYFDETIVETFYSDWCSCVLNTSDYSAGEHSIKAVAFDTIDNSSTHEIVIQIKECNPPQVQNPVDDLVLVEGFLSYEINISTVFNDPDGDELSYECNSDDESVVTVDVLDSILVLTEAGIGSANITLIATDETDYSATDVFMISVSDSTNQNPILVNPVDDINLDGGFNAYSIDISNIFIDIDGDLLSYTVENDNSNVVEVVLSGTSLVIFEEASGTTNIKLIANDGKGGIAYNTFSINVSAVSGIEEDPLSNILIYPNPAHDKFYVKFQDIGLSNTYLEIFDITGIMRAKHELKAQINEIDINNLSLSTYFLKIYQNDRIKVMKIVKY